MAEASFDPSSEGSLEDVPLGLALFDASDRFLQVNGPLCEILGRTKDQLLAANHADVLHSDDRAEDRRRLDELLAGKETRYRLDLRYVRPGGEVRWCTVTASAVAGATRGPPAGPVVVRRVLDVTERRQAEELLRRSEAALRESEERFRRIFEESPVGVAIVDSSLRFIRLNAALGEMLGYREEELKGCSLTEVTHPEDVNLDARLARRAFAGEISGYEIEKRFLRRDGEVRWGRVRASVIRDESGKALYGLTLVEDISEAKEAEAARRDLDALKDGFLRVVSHDLQGPLVTIAGLAAVLAGDAGRQSTREQELLERIAAHAERLRRTVATFLDVDRLYQGGVRAARRPTELAGLVERVVKDLDRREHPLSVDVPGLVVDVDPDQVEHIVENLLDNAFIHTPPRTPVWLWVEEEAGGAAITVEDAGPGVPGDLKGAVFELFRTGDAQARRTGIGLWMVARFAQLHGGRAWVEDRPGGGARFRVVLPGEDGEERLF